MRKMITDVSCLAHFARDQDNVVTTDAILSGLGITLWQRQDVNTNRPIAFARYLKDAEKNYSVAELELLTVVWGLEEFRFYLCGKGVNLYTDYQALEPASKRNRAYRQKNALLTRWLNRLAHFDISEKHTAVMNSVMSDCLSPHPTEEDKTEEGHEEEYVISILVNFFKLSQIHLQFPK